jgi:rhodanese-related sulfurtransferase
VTRTAAELLEEARRGLQRLTPAQASEAMRAGAVLVDIRDDTQRAREGEIAGSWIVPRNVLEWRFACAEGARDPRLPDRDGLPIVLCGQGFQSSLVARELQQLGFTRATDVIGGFAGWVEAGLAVEPYGTRDVTRAIAGGPDDPLPGTYA